MLRFVREYECEQASGGGHERSLPKPAVLYSTCGLRVGGSSHPPPDGSIATPSPLGQRKDPLLHWGPERSFKTGCASEGRGGGKSK